MNFSTPSCSAPTQVWKNNAQVCYKRGALGGHACVTLQPLRITQGGRQRMWMACAAGSGPCTLVLTHAPTANTTQRLPARPSP